MKTLLRRLPGLVAFVHQVRKRSVQRPRRRLLAALPARSIGAEIGVHLGDFSREILRVVAPAKLHLIDPWAYAPGEAYDAAWYGGRAAEGQATMDERFQAVERRFAAEIASGQIHVHRGRADQVADAFDDGYFDWVYIDGNHLYEYVRFDLENYLPKIRSGGLLTGDDYGVEGWWQNGVQRAVDEFVERHSLPLEIRGTQFLIRKGGRRP